jgi:hypothetical protein
MAGRRHRNVFGQALDDAEEGRLDEIEEHGSSGANGVRTCSIRATEAAAARLTRGRIASFRARNATSRPGHRCARPGLQQGCGLWYEPAEIAARHRPVESAECRGTYKEARMPAKLVHFDEETWHALELLARDRKRDFEHLADEAFSDLLRKHRRPQKREA